MPKQEIKLKKAVREACERVMARRTELELAPRWSQAETAAAIAYAAEQHEWGKDGAVKEFIALGDYGFLGNASQFRQALEALPDGDALKLAKGSAGDLDLYS